MTSHKKKLIQKSQKKHSFITESSDISQRGGKNEKLIGIRFIRRVLEIQRVQDKGNQKEEEFKILPWPSSLRLSTRSAPPFPAPPSGFRFSENERGRCSDIYSARFWRNIKSQTLGVISSLKIV